MTIGLDELLVLERQVWKALVDGDGAADGRLLSDDFLGVYPTGFADRAAHVGQLTGGPTVESFAIHDATVMTLTDELVLLAYRAVYRRAAATADDEMYISSLWARRAGRWINVFSQDTPSAAP